MSTSHGVGSVCAPLAPSNGSKIMDFSQLRTNQPPRIPPAPPISRRPMLGHASPKRQQSHSPPNNRIRRARNSKTSVETLRDRPRGIKSPIIRPRLLLFTEPTPVPGWHGLRISPQASLGSASLLLSISELLVIRVFDIVPGHPRSDDGLIDLGATDDTSFCPIRITAPDRACDPK